MTATTAPVTIRYAPRGAARELFAAREPEVLIAGPAGTGKTTALLHYLHLRLLRHAGARGLIVRKTLTALVSSALVTYQEQVLHPLDGVQFYGGSKATPAHFRYPNGSVLVVGGLDNAAKVLSTDYDLIVVIEATELALGDWETLSTRARHGAAPVQQLMGDCNPNAPTHWLYQRTQAGLTRLLTSRHEDNPLLHDGLTWTTPGRAYLARLATLSGVRRLRLLEGRWAAAEGLVYDGWDARIHVVERFAIPPDWPRIEGVDFGFVNAFVWQRWAVDHDGRLYLEQEIYATQTLVEDHARAIAAATKDAPRAIALVCDHDAQERATLERHLGRRTTPARKAILAGIQAVAERLRVQPDGRPRLMLMRDATHARDRALVEAGRPASTAEEFEGYVWEAGGKERPVDRDNHGVDVVRYICMHLDGGADRRVRVA